MSTPDAPSHADSSLAESLATMAENARAAARELALIDTAVKNRILEAIATGLTNRKQEILDANAADLADAATQGLSEAMTDRLRLDSDRIDALAEDVRRVIKLPDPVGDVLEEFEGAEGIKIKKTRVPIGVIALLYEARPNVTIDASVLCLKAGNAVILRGGKEALRTNIALARVAQESGARLALPDHSIQWLETTDREAIGLLVGMRGQIDLAIPRGGHGLIQTVLNHARVPVIKHFDGICHVFVDRMAKLDMAEKIVLNAKTQRPGVCNAMETLLVDRMIASTAVPQLAAALHGAGVAIHACEASAPLLGEIPFQAATPETWTTEHLALALGLKVVKDVEEAITHINTHGSHHSDAIITNNPRNARRFLDAVDSACVYWNASTRFTDGGQFGFGAEIGISTDKIHARGPMGLRELTTHKYLVTGTGQVRA